MLDIGDAAAGNGTGVVDEDVDVGERLMQPLPRAGVRQVGRVGGTAALCLRLTSPAASSSAAWLRETMTTLAPSAANACAIACRFLSSRR